MRKFIRFIAVLAILVFSSSISLAADEITFRSIPWGSGYDATIDALSDAGITWKKPEKKLGVLIADEVVSSLDDASMNYPDICFVDSKNVNLKVAGYDVNEVALYFAYTPDANGEITHDTDNTSFYMAMYKISTDETGYPGVIRDLKKKLSDIYGTPKEVDLSDDCNAVTKDYWQWKGSNGTFVYLNGEPNDVWNFFYVRLWYGTSEGDTLVKQAEKTQEDGVTKKLREGGSDGL